MMKYDFIATHNSGTGEDSYSIWDAILIPFACCQSKTLYEQVMAGVTLFDIRVKSINGDGLFLAHGLWRSCVPLFTALTLMQRAYNKMASMDSGYKEQFPRIFVFVTYEGRLSKEKEIAFTGTVRGINEFFPNVAIYAISVKRPKWRTVWNDSMIPPIKYIRDFEVLERGNWRRFIPIPRFWAWVRGRFWNSSATTTYVMCDFI